MWTVETFSDAVDKEILALPSDMRARLARLSFLIEAYGFDALPHHTVKHLEERLWELRVTGRDGIARAIYLTDTAKRVIILTAFVKKTQKTPAGALALARQRAKDIA